MDSTGSIRPWLAPRRRGGGGGVGAAARGGEGCRARAVGGGGRGKWTPPGRCACGSRPGGVAAKEEGRGSWWRKAVPNARRRR